MKLYAYQPTGHGQSSFFVMAENEQEAFNFVSQHIHRTYPPNGYSTQGWGTDYYKLTVFEPGQVAENDND